MLRYVLITVSALVIIGGLAFTSCVKTPGTADGVAAPVEEAADTDTTTDAGVESTDEVVKEEPVEEAALDVTEYEVYKEAVVEEPTYDDVVHYLANGILVRKNRRDGGRWFECGKLYETEEAMRHAAYDWASEIYKQQQSITYSYKPKGKKRRRIKIGLVGLVGTIANESNFDRCAIGPSSRIWALQNRYYGEKILPEKRPHLSYYKEEIMAILENPKWRRMKGLADLGPGQIVWGPKKKRSIYKGDDPENLLTLRPGIRLVVEEMARRGKRYNTRHPWAHWPGRVACYNYSHKVMRYGDYILERGKMRYNKRKALTS